MYIDIHLYIYIYTYVPQNLSSDFEQVCICTYKHTCENIYIYIYIESFILL